MTENLIMGNDPSEAHGTAITNRGDIHSGGVGIIGTSTFSGTTIISMLRVFSN